jgi:hypothetical protein
LLPLAASFREGSGSQTDCFTAKYSASWLCNMAAPAHLHDPADPRPQLLNDVIHLHVASLPRASAASDAQTHLHLGCTA